MSDSGIPKIRTILCAFDFSETARLALTQALWFATQHGARVVLAHIVEPIPLGPYPAMTAPGNDLVIRDVAARRIEELAESLRGNQIDLTVRVKTGEPGPRLIEASTSVAADLVVIGTQGLTGLPHLLMGSTAEYVVRRSECPVLTVHPSDRILENQLERVVLPTDLSPDAHYAAGAFIDLFQGPVKPRVVLAYADRTPPYLEPFRHEMLSKLDEQDVMKEEIERKMEPSVTALRDAGFDVETIVLDGEPVSVITDLAKERKADLILLGTHGRSAIANALLGRTAQRIVQHAQCPVLTVRRKKETAGH
jgi:nucleotide-binding universal stress UspA family protein